MGIFGWSYPPGCSGPPDEYEGPCELCGHEVDDCICPECPQCGAQGDPCCYSRHGMVLNEQQADGQAAALRREQENADACQAEAAYWADPQRQREEAEYWAEEALHNKG